MIKPLDDIKWWDGRERVPMDLLVNTMLPCSATVRSLLPARQGTIPHLDSKEGNVHVSS